MGKKNKQFPHAPRVAPTPLVHVEAKKQGVATNESSAAATESAAGGAAAAAAANAAATAVTDGGDAMSRKEQVAAMPRMGAVTKLAPVTKCTSILLVPLRSGAAAAAYFDEGATPTVIAERVREFAKCIGTVVEADIGMDLGSISDGGRVDLQAQRDAAQRNQARGIFKLRVEEAYAPAVRAAVRPIAIVLPDDVSDATHEVVADSKIYPGAMVEQIWIQNGIAAVPMWNRAEQATSYLFKFGSAAAEALVESKEYLVKLGKNGTHGTFVPRPIRKRITWETIFAYGITGQGSGRDFLLPEVADAIGVSTDMVRLTSAQGVKRGVGFVAAITFPYDKGRYAKVMELLDIAHFRLPIGASSLAITLAASPVELANTLAINLVQEEEEEEEEEEKPKPLELRFEEGAHAGPLIPAARWEAWREAGRQAALASVARAKAAANAGHGERGMHSCAARNTMLSCATRGTMHSCASQTLNTPLVQFSLAQSTSREEAAPRRHLGDRERSVGEGGGSATGCLAAGRGTPGAGAGSHERHWRWRPQNHLLAWGYDARGCGGGRSK